MDKVGLQAGECLFAYTCLLHQTVDFVCEKFSVTPLFIHQNSHLLPTTRLPNEDEESEVELEEDWFGTQEDAVPAAQASSKTLEVMANEVGCLVVTDAWILGLIAFQ